MNLKSNLTRTTANILKRNEKKFEENKITSVLQLVNAVNKFANHFTRESRNFVVY